MEERKSHINVLELKAVELAIMTSTIGERCNNGSHPDGQHNNPVILMKMGGVVLYIEVIKIILSLFVYLFFFRKRFRAHKNTSQANIS